MNAYDQIPYPDLSYVHTHPDRLSTMGRLLGRETADVGRCRFLEVGCAAGGNLLPMAAGLSKSEFVGIDYSVRQIDIGQQRIDALGMSNLSLHAKNLMDDLDELGDFDFIVAHGVYSWVEPNVRDGLMRLLQSRLRPDGIAYVSYNTYPGWHITEIIREAMLYHARAEDQPEQKARRAREMLEIMAEHATESAYGGIFRSYADFLKAGLKGSSDAFLLHDELEVVNQPVYFSDFVAHAARHDLAYLVEVELQQVLPHVFKPETQTLLQSVSTSALELEQYMDFFRNRMFRQTLLIHKDDEAQKMLHPQPLFQMKIRSQAEEVEPEEGSPEGTRQFQAKDGTTLSTDHPVSQAAMRILARCFPKAMDFGDLLSASLAEVADSKPSDAATRRVPDDLALAATLLRAHGQSSQLAQLHLFVPDFTTALSETPVALPVARFEAKTRSVVTNAWHERVTLQPVQQDILRQLDGTVNRSELVADIANREDIPVSEVEIHLRWLAHSALLVV